LKPQKAPGELDHAAAVPGIAGCGEPLFPPFRAALVRRTRQAGVAGHGSAVTHRPRQHLIDEHICRFNADADNPSTRTIRNSPARSSPDSPLEGAGFEPSVPATYDAFEIVLYAYAAFLC
jgi:hypothetical protein